MLQRQRKKLLVLLMDKTQVFANVTGTEKINASVIQDREKNC